LNIYEFIKRKYLRLSKGQRKVAQFILEQPQSIVNNVASEVGRLAGVSESTVIRFCYAMDLTGYSELQGKLEEYLTVVNATTSPKIEKASAANVIKNDMLNQIKCISKVIEKLDSKQIGTVLSIVQDVRKIYVAGYRENERYAQFLQHNLAAEKFNIETIEKNEFKISQALNQFDQSDLLILFGDNEIYNDTDFILQHAVAKKMKIVLVYFTPKHEYIRKCDAHIYIHNVMENAASAYSVLLSLVENIKSYKGNTSCSSL
jgi:DNA-binding MurR/RpiR family transcriptional regulator